MIHVQDSCRDELQDVANALGLAQRIVVITGAGVSTDAGIPVCCSLSSLKSLY
jgi:NAD-dependent SIR2 family protein deacetylase